MESIRSQLVDMGFHESKVSRALQSCPEAKTLEQVMEWLIAHEDELNSEPQSNSNVGGTAKSEAKDPSASNSGPQTSVNNKSPQPPEGESKETASNMAARKKITIEEAQRLIAERLAKRAEEERKKAIEDEKKRRLVGQKLIETRAELEDQEKIRMAQKIRQDKLETELHKKKILDQIARDREAMRNKNKPAEPNKTSKPDAAADSSKIQGPRTTATECKLALRFPDGTSKVQTFPPKGQLEAVKDFVKTHLDSIRCSNIEFVAPPNKKLTQSMMSETLENLGLCPASRLEVKYTKSEWADLD